MASRKLARAAALIKQSVSKVILYELNDPRMKATVTVTRVKVSAELRTADVFVSMMGTDSEIATTHRALVHAAGHITSLVGSRLQLRNTPVLRFILDDSLKKGFAVTKLIDQAMEEIRRKEAAQDPEAAPPEGASEPAADAAEIAEAAAPPAPRGDEQ